MITVIDLNGCSLEVDDLEKAIAQMAEFKDWQHADDVISECDKQRQVYYKDLYEKLLEIQARLKINKSCYNGN